MRRLLKHLVLLTALLLPSTALAQVTLAGVVKDASVTCCRASRLKPRAPC